MKKILITGENSYIGEYVKRYLSREPNDYKVDVRNTIGWKPNVSDFNGYDVVFNVAGIAHIKEEKSNRHLYYAVNRDLVVEIAKKAKKAGIGQFVLLSSMSVYGLSVGNIDKYTKPNPVNAYGKSKLEADEKIKGLADESFIFTCIRPPMVYGKGCKGNYDKLRKIAINSPFFPEYKNERSMIYIGNLCEFIKNCIDGKRSGVFFPQNAEYINTSNMVKIIAEIHGKRIRMVSFFNWLIKNIPLQIVRKAFGDLTYEKTDIVSKYGFRESILLTERD